MSLDRRGGGLAAGGALLLLASCTGARPSGPSRVEAPVAATEPQAAANAAPAIAGDAVCIGPAGRPHVFTLVLTDADGDSISWRTERVESRGRVDPSSGPAVASGTAVELTYTPPPGRDENTIVFTATDSRGASTTLRLYARSG